MTLAEHERRLAQDLDTLGLPPANWPATVAGPDGRPMRDVVVVGAGGFGLAAAATLILKGVRNIAVLDRAPEGYEGPWLTTARMQTLRSPKGLPGLALGIPALSFRAWYTARFGAAAWDALYKISNADWQAYLGWVRRVLALPVQNGIAVRTIRPHRAHLLVETDRGEVLHARRVVLATGRSREDNARIPDFVDPALRPERAAHTGEAIDFTRLAGRRVAVLGGGASAWDNAATALEAGAARVDIYIRRRFLPQINKWRAAFHPGVFEGWPSWPPALRWEWLVHLQDQPPPPPHESIHRVLAHPNVALHPAHPVIAASPHGAGLALRFGPPAGGTAEADFLILATGFEAALPRAPELAALLPHLATWAERYTPPPALARPGLGGLPYLGEGFELTEKTPGGCPAVGRVHLFNAASVASAGAIGSEIPGLSAGAERLASRIVAAFSLEDNAHLRAVVEAYEEPELVSTPYFAPEAFARR